MKLASLFLLLGACKPPQPAVELASMPPSPPATDDAIYFVLVDRFADGDATNNDGVNREDPQGWHGGDIQGIINQLDHIQSMGFKTVWLSPVFESRDEAFMEWGAYHGYWVESLDRIDERFGSGATLRALGDALHKRGMRLTLDVVYNHTAMDSELSRSHPDWFHEAAPIENWEDPDELVSNQVHGLPDLDQDNPEVREYLIASTKRWIREAGVDELRVDAVRHIDPGFFRTLRAELQAELSQDMPTIGEIFEGSPHRLLSTWGAAEFPAAFDFPLYYALIDSVCKGQPAGRIASTLAHNRWEDAPGEWVTFLDNHDLPRVASVCGQEKVPLLLEMLMTTRGRPMISYGTESGLEGVDEPANRGDMDFSNTPYANTIRDLLALRSSSAPLHQGDSQVIGLSERGYVVLRTTPTSGVALVGVNLGDEALVLELPSWLPQDEWRPLLGEPSFSGGKLTLPASSVGVLERSESVVLDLPATQRLRFTGPADGSPTPALLAGAGEPLGNWDPSKAHAMGSELELPVYAVLAYKLVFDCLSEVPKWESGGNRYLLVKPDPEPTTVEVDFRSPPDQESHGSP